jgi:outer membrane lipoprotein LolB
VKRFVGPLLILLLAGCATTAALKTSRSPADFSDWQLNGRIALTHGDEGWHASLLWQEQADGYQLKVSGPLGQGGFQIAGDEHGVVLVDASGQSSYAQDVPNVEAIEVYDAVGQLSRLEQSGWVINYQKYKLVEGAAVPSKMQLARNDVAVRLVISEWQLGPPKTVAP